MSFACRTVLMSGTLLAAASCSRSASPPSPAPVTCPELLLERTRRLYDYRAVSSSNPVVPSYVRAIVRHCLRFAAVLHSVRWAS